MNITWAFGLCRVRQDPERSLTEWDRNNQKKNVLMCIYPIFRVAKQTTYRSYIREMRKSHHLLPPMTTCDPVPASKASNINLELLIWGATEQNVKFGLFFWGLSANEKANYTNCHICVTQQSAHLHSWSTSTRSEAFFLLICLDASEFVMLSVLTLVETICPKIWAKPLSKNN